MAKARIGDGMPVFGTCAGMILLATEVLDGRPDQRSFGAIDIAVRRNGYGRQIDSFEADLDVVGSRRRRSTPCSSGPRRSSASAPASRCSPSTTGVPVLARQGRVIVASFHPELTGDAGCTPSSFDRTITVGAPMSGHSKWATIKHKKGAADKARGKLFAKLARQLEVAARDGGGDPDVQRRRCARRCRRPRPAQMTNDAIDRAIKRGTGEGDGRHLRGDHLRGLRARAAWRC